VIADFLARLLEPGEGEAVLGDLAERGTSGGAAICEVAGLVARRQARFAADGSSVTLWMYFNNRDWNLVQLPAFRHDFPHFLLLVAGAYAILACWSWIVGFAIGALSRRTAVLNGALLCLLLLLAQFVGLPLLLHGSITTGREYRPNGPVFTVWFYRAMLPVLVQMILVILPSVLGVRQGFRFAGFGQPVKALLMSAAILSGIPIVWLGLVWFDHFTNRPAAGPLYNSLMAQLWLGWVNWWPVVYWTTQATGRWKERNVWTRS
jgi:hypothetical protein